MASAVLSYPLVAAPSMPQLSTHLDVLLRQPQPVPWLQRLPLAALIPLQPCFAPACGNRLLLSQPPWILKDSACMCSRWLTQLQGAVHLPAHPGRALQQRQQRQGGIVGGRQPRHDPQRNLLHVLSQVPARRVCCCLKPQQHSAAASCQSDDAPPPCPLPHLRIVSAHSAVLNVSSRSCASRSSTADWLRSCCAEASVVAGGQGAGSGWQCIQYEQQTRYGCTSQSHVPSCNPCQGLH